MLRLASELPRPSEAHRGYEISYVANERSWYIRADAEAPRSHNSFRSAFQARRAIDDLIDRPKAAAAGAGSKKKG
jgi:hypothetical protein